MRLYSAALFFNQETILMTKSTRIAGFAVAGALAAGLLLAQVPGFHRGERMKQLLATQLELTDAQKIQAKTIFETARQQAEPVVQQLKQGHEAVAAAVKANKSDQEIQQLANAQGALAGQLGGIHAKAMAKFYATLTPEQKDKADKLHECMKGFMEGAHSGHRPF